MEKKKIIGIMGPGEGATTSDEELTFNLGKAIAEKGFIVLTGGRASGVMEAAMKGAKSAGGTTIGILPSEDGTDQSEFVDITIKTGLGSARNNINVLTANVIVAVGIGPGTASEISLAIKANKPVVLLNQQSATLSFFRLFDYPKLHIASNINEAINSISEAI